MIFQLHMPVFRKILWLFGLTVGILAIKLVLFDVAPKGMTNPVDHPLTAISLSPATGPLRVHAVNPRYFDDGTGKIIYLVGAHTWMNLQEYSSSNPPPAFDYPAFLDFLQENNHNFFRLWAWEQAKWGPWTTDAIWFAPLPYQRTGPGIALDGSPKFDLTKFNQAYFDRMRARIIQARERGMYVSIMLFNGFSIDSKATGPGNAWPGHPYNVQNNINGINGDANQNNEGEETHTLQVPSVTTIQQAYVKKVIDTVNDLDNVLYEISNESPANSQAWQYSMIDFIKNYEKSKPKQHPVGMTVEYPDGDNRELFSSPADWISPNPSGGYKDNPPIADGSKVMILDTDHLWGVGGDRQWAWESFTRGHNLLYMDCFGGANNDCPGWNPDDPTRLSILANMGYILKYAKRIGLAAMTPQDDLCSTAYCLANPAVNNAEYLVYLPNGGTVNVDLMGTPGELSIEWLNPETGETMADGTTTGGASRSFTAPFAGDAVLYLYQTAATPQFRLFLPVVGQGTVSSKPLGPYNAGQQVRLSAIPASGWDFSAWSGAVAEAMNPFTVTITQDATITATFRERAPSLTYTLTVQAAGEGEVTVDPPGPYLSGQTIRVTAVPTVGWRFVGWQGAIFASANPATLVIADNAFLTATFIQEPVGSHTILVRTTGNGAVALSVSDVFTQGQTIELTALPDQNWQFAGWHGDVMDDANSITVTITGNLTIAADFITQVFMPAVSR